MSEIIQIRPIERLWKLLTDREYRQAYKISHVGGNLAAQIYRLRTDNGMTQKALAALTGSPQSQISAWESSCDNISLSSLHRIADAFDVGLVVRFAPYSEIAQDTLSARTLNIHIPPFDEDSPLARIPEGQISFGSASTWFGRVDNQSSRRNPIVISDQQSWNVSSSGQQPSRELQIA